MKIRLSRMRLQYSKLNSKCKAIYSILGRFLNTKFLFYTWYISFVSFYLEFKFGLKGNVKYKKTIRYPNFNVIKEVYISCVFMEVPE